MSSKARHAHVPRWFYVRARKALTGALNQHVVCYARRCDPKRVAFLIGRRWQVLYLTAAKRRAYVEIVGRAPWRECEIVEAQFLRHFCL